MNLIRTTHSILTWTIMDSSSKQRIKSWKVLHSVIVKNDPVSILDFRSPFCCCLVSLLILTFISAHLLIFRHYFHSCFHPHSKEIDFLQPVRNEKTPNDYFYTRKTISITLSSLTTFRRGGGIKWKNTHCSIKDDLKGSKTEIFKVCVIMDPSIPFLDASSNLSSAKQQVSRLCPL